MGFFSEILVCIADSMLNDLTKNKESKIGKGINLLNDQAQKLTDSVEREKAKMYNYTEDELLRESKRGGSPHMIAAKMLLNELYGYNF